ncbi:hypothetical protein DIPPA_17376 [Diplonema papillatum]|nr:hypothetical protein DIPPA_17376 [Diplonema papillatum]
MRCTPRYLLLVAVFLVAACVVRRPHLGNARKSDVEHQQTPSVASNALDPPSVSFPPPSVSFVRTAKETTERRMLIVELQQTLTDMGLLRRTQPKLASNKRLVRLLEAEAVRLSVQLAEQDRVLPRCTSTEHFVNGSLRALAGPDGRRVYSWAPDTCSVPAVEAIPGVRECFANNMPMFIGDTLTSSLMRQYIALSNSTASIEKSYGKPAVDLVSVYGSPTASLRPAAVHTLFSGVQHEGGFRTKHSMELLKEADYVVLGGCVHDIDGHSYIAPDKYFDKLVELLKFTRETMKPDATLALFLLHTLHTETQCSVSDWCRLCCNPVKVQTYREVQLLAASCTGVKIFDTTQMTQNPGLFTQDGINLDSNIHVEGSLFVNHMCNGLPFSNTRRMPCEPGDIDRMKTKWMATPEALVVCHKKPAMVLHTDAAKLEELLRASGASIVLNADATASAKLQGLLIAHAETKRGRPLNATRLKLIEAEAYPLSNELAEQDRLLPRCTSVEQFANGSLRAWKTPRSMELAWAPDTCFMPAVKTIPGVRDCFANNMPMFIGDSLTEQLARQYMTLSNPAITVEKTYGKPHADLVYVYGSPTLPARRPAAVFTWFPAVNHEGGFRTNHSMALFKTADFVVYGGGMHDMGRGFGHSNPDVYFDTLLVHLKFMQNEMKPGATLALFLLHTLHTETRCNATELCRRCNNPVKEQTYREVQLLAASCTGVNIFDTTQMIQHMQNFTQDGIHGSTSVEGALFINHMCNGFPFSNARRMTCTPKVIDQMKKKWLSTPLALQRCYPDSASVTPKPAR